MNAPPGGGSFVVVSDASDGMQCRPPSVP